MKKLQISFIFFILVCFTLLRGRTQAEYPEGLPEWQLPSMPITTAIEKAHKFIAQNEIDVSNRFLSSVRFQEVSLAEESPVIKAMGPSWHFTFEPKARSLGGQLFLSVYMDGAIRHAYGR